jgi:hypothetical protein
MTGVNVQDAEFGYVNDFGYKYYCLRRKTVFLLESVISQVLAVSVLPAAVNTSTFIKMSRS